MWRCPCGVENPDSKVQCRGCGVSKERAMRVADGTPASQYLPPHQRKEYKTLRLISQLTSAFGWGIVGFFAFMGMIMGIGLLGPLGILLGPLLGAITGIPYVAMGQLIGVFMDQKEILEEILTSLKTRSAS